MACGGKKACKFALKFDKLSIFIFVNAPGDHLSTPNFSMDEQLHCCLLSMMLTIVVYDRYTLIKMLQLDNRQQTELIFINKLAVFETVLDGFATQ